MAKPFRGVINVDVTKSVPDWEPYTQTIAPEGTPSVLYIVLDDVGYSAMGAYGGLIETPNIDRIAQRGLTYTNFHTTALCSPTRSCLMTGRNHTTNGMATITEAASGFPSSNGHIPFECATIAEVLGERGWNTYMTGKWHLTAEDEMNMASRKAQWPVGRGFERFYGFLGAETNQWYPDLVYDNHPVEQPTLPSEGYHLTVDLTDRALEFIRDAKAVAPDKPFFLYFCPGACHAPHHAPKEWIDKYRGKFDMGYEAYRELVFERQKRMGVITDKAELSPINPYISQTSADGKGWPEADTVRPWDSLTDAEKRLFARMAEVYAGFLAHADHEIGRLMDYLEQSGQLDNTIIVLVSDNGASGEGGPNGSVNENKYFNGIPDNIEANLSHLDELGSPATYNHYPTGWAWAFNTPFKMWKRYSNYEGGTADPMIVSWPARITSAGVRRQYVHAVDIVPTLYSMLGIEMPDVVKGYPQIPLEGVSFDATLNDATATTDKQTQFYSMGGTRAIWHQGWKAAALSPAAPDMWAGYATQHWELFNTVEDPSECHDLAAQEPEKLQELIQLWWAQAGQYGALPLENRVTLEIPDAGGVLFAHGARFGGHALYLKDGKLKYVYNFVGDLEQIVESTEALPVGHAALSASFERDGDSMPAEGTLTLYVGERQVGQGRIKTQPGKFSIAGEGLNIGKDGAEPVTDDYPGGSPWCFSGGTIHRAAVDVSGAPFVDLAAEARMAFLRD